MTDDLTPQAGVAITEGLTGGEKDHVVYECECNDKVSKT